MNQKCTIDFETYKWLLKSLNTASLHDGSKATLEDIDFIKDDTWLSATSVIENVAKRKGSWHIDLVFAYYKDPLRFIIRKITQHNSFKQATLIASLFRRQAAKDQRGTIEIDIDKLNIHYN